MDPDIRLLGRYELMQDLVFMSMSLEKAFFISLAKKKFLHYLRKGIKALFPDCLELSRVAHSFCPQSAIANIPSNLLKSSVPQIGKPHCNDLCIRRGSENTTVFIFEFLFKLFVIVCSPQIQPPPSR